MIKNNTKVRLKETEHGRRGTFKKGSEGIIAGRGWSGKPSNKFVCVKFSDGKKLMTHEEKLEVIK